MTILSTEFFPHRARLQVRQRTTDSLGGSSDALVTVDTEVPCWQQQATAREIAEYKQMGHDITSKVYFLEDPQLTPRHEVVITSRRVDGTWVTVNDPLETLTIVAKTGPDAFAGFQGLFKYFGNINSATKARS